MERHIKTPEETEGDLIEFAESIEDFDLEKTKVVYEVWALGYDQDMNATDFEYFLDGDYAEVDEARKCLEYFSKENTLVAYLENNNLPVPADTKHIHLMLEMCVELEDGSTECQDIVEEVEIY